MSRCVNQPRLGTECGVVEVPQVRINTAKATEVAEFANATGRYYAPATEDLWFKFATGSDGQVVSRIFAKCAAALSFRHCDTNFLGIGNNDASDVLLFNSRPNNDRRVATDFAAAVRLKNQNIDMDLDSLAGVKDKLIKEVLANDFKMRENIESQFCIFGDAIKRGVIISSEMQVVSKINTAGYDDMIDRADDYVAFWKQHDHGKGSANGRVLKQDSDGETSRSIAEVVWEVSDKATEIKQNVNCLARSIHDPEMQCARGDIVTFVPLIDVSKQHLDVPSKNDKFKRDVKGLIGETDNRVNAYFENISAVTEETKKLVREVVSVMNFSHLMWPELVGTFTHQVQEMCERLKITGGRIMEIGNKSEYIRSLVGKFEELEQERARANNAENRANNAENRAAEAENKLKTTRHSLRDAARKGKSVQDLMKELGISGQSDSSVPQSPVKPLQNRSSAKGKGTEKRQPPVKGGRT